MKTIKGPALFLAQFAGDEAPFNTWDGITKWACDMGYVGVQVPSWDARLIDLDKAADSATYCDDWLGQARDNGIEVTELSTHLQGQLVAVHPCQSRFRLHRRVFAHGHGIEVFDDNLRLGKPGVDVTT